VIVVSVRSRLGPAISALRQRIVIPLSKADIVIDNIIVLGVRKEYSEKELGCFRNARAARSSDRSLADRS
jgi:hypothetical protein